MEPGVLVVSCGVQSSRVSAYMMLPMLPTMLASMISIPSRVDPNLPEEAHALPKASPKNPNLHAMGICTKRNKSQQKNVFMQE